MKDKKKLLNVIGKILSVLSIAFVIYAIWKMGFDLSFVTNIPLFVLVVVIGIFMKMLSVLTSSTAWTRWLIFFSRVPVDRSKGSQAFMKANIGKYIPGNVMHFIQRNLFASSMGISQLQLAVSSIFEVLSYVFVALMIAVLTAWDNLQLVLKNYFGDSLPILSIGTVCVLLGLAAVVFVLRKKIGRVLSDKNPKQFVQALVSVMIRQLVTLILLGLVMVLLYWYAKGSFTWTEFGTIISTYVVAWVLGFVVPGASGGIGIREVALLLLLGPIMGDSLVLALAVVHRLITVIGDFLCYLCAIVWEKRGSKNA